MDLIKFYKDKHQVLPMDVTFMRVDSGEEEWEWLKEILTFISKASVSFDFC